MVFDAMRGPGRGLKRRNLDHTLSDSRRTDMCALDGITVVSLEHALAAPFATRPRFVRNALRSTNRSELAAKIADANVNDMSGLWAHPQLAARHRWVDVQTPGGVIPALLPPGQMRARMDPVPALSAQTEAILAELGLSAT